MKTNKADVDNWNVRFQMVCDMLKDITIIITQNKNLDPKVVEGMTNTLKLMVQKL